MLGSIKAYSNAVECRTLDCVPYPYQWVMIRSSPVIKLPDGPCLGLNLTWVTIFITLIDYTDKRQDGSTSTDKESSSNRSRPDGSRYRVSHPNPAPSVS
jgi:hypothetical protein